MDTKLDTKAEPKANIVFRIIVRFSKLDIP